MLHSCFKMILFFCFLFQFLIEVFCGLTFVATACWKPQKCVIFFISQFPLFIFFSLPLPLSLSLSQKTHIFDVPKVLICLTFPANFLVIISQMLLPFAYFFQKLKSIKGALSSLFACSTQNLRSFIVSATRNFVLRATFQFPSLLRFKFKYFERWHNARTVNYNMTIMEIMLTCVALFSAIQRFF